MFLSHLGTPATPQSAAWSSNTGTGCCIFSESAQTSAAILSSRLSKSDIWVFRFQKLTNRVHHTAQKQRIGFPRSQLHSCDKYYSGWLIKRTNGKGRLKIICTDGWNRALCLWGHKLQQAGYAGNFFRPETLKNYDNWSEMGWSVKNVLLNLDWNLLQPA